MKKFFVAIFLCFLCICSVNLLGQTANAENDVKYIINSNNAVVYASADFSSDTVITLSRGTQVNLQNSEGQPQRYENEGFCFYKILGEIEGFVLCDFVSTESDTIQTIPNYNAKTNSSCKVFYENNGQMQESDISLEKGKRIFLYQGYNSKREFCAIEFEKENKIVYGYVQTKFVAPDGINPLIITCVVVILAVLGIIFAWLFMKNKKIKKLKK